MKYHVIGMHTNESHTAHLCTANPQPIVMRAPKRSDLFAHQGKQGRLYRNPGNTGRHKYLTFTGKSMIFLFDFEPMLHKELQE